MVRPISVNFTDVPDIYQHSSGNIQYHSKDPRPVGPNGKLLTPKQIRARARRAGARGSKTTMTVADFNALYKPVDEWDMEELARGRPRGSDGTFRGKMPAWVSRTVYEQSMERFKKLLKNDMNALSVTAMSTLEHLLTSDDVDDRGRPVVPASVKSQVAQFLMEHVVGKPTQVVQQDISVRLQGILGMAMVNPNDALAPSTHGGEGMALAHFPGQTIPLGVPDDEIIEGELEE